MADREQMIADAQALLDWLGDNPSVPLNPHNIPWHYHVGPLDKPVDDAAGIARVREIALQIGAEVEVSGGTHHYARRRFGCVAYEASYIVRQEMADGAVRDRLGREALKALKEAAADG